MSGSRDQKQAQDELGAGDDGSGGPDGSDAAAVDGGSVVESWLRDIAHVPSAPAQVLLPRAGQVIGGKYKIEEQLGKGGMGAVYRATHTVSEKPVALKWMLRPTSDERAQQRFTREARAAGRIDHPNVVDVYDIGQDGDASYLVMELLHGESLRARLTRARAPLPPTEAIDLLLPAIRGVAAAHRQGVIHRDLKPDNIFLCRSPDGALREAKVLDFGISTINAPGYDSKTTLTKEGTVLGTPTYMSPEQLEDVRDVDARTDVYAFGVILYEVLTGSVPFRADSYSSLVLAIANSKPKAPREARPEIPVQLSAAVMRAMEKDRNVRLQSMEALLAALSPFASVKSAGSGEHRSIELRRPVRAGGRRGQVGIVIGVAVAALLALGWWWMRPSAAPPKAAREPTQAPRVAEAPQAVTATPQAPSADAMPSLPAASPSAVSTREPAHARPAQKLARAHTQPSAAPKASLQATPAASASEKKARSGTIVVDDL